MRSFSVKIGNDKSWSYNGAISREFLVFSEDIMGALMEAAEQMEALKAALLVEHCPEKDISTIRIHSLGEHAEVCGKTSVKLLSGSYVGDSMSDPDDWAKRTALKIRTERNS